MSSASPDAPAASVLLPAYRSQRTVARSLDALAAQTFQDFETIVVDSSPDGATAEVVRRFPHVELILVERRMLPHEARNVGAARARGRILVFTDPDCCASPDWLERLVAAHDSGWQIAGGGVAPMPGLWNRALHWTRYGWWMTGGPAATRPEIPSANQSFSRALWDELQGYQTEHFASDSQICWRAVQAGHEIRYDPDAVVVHDHPLSVAQLAHDRFSRGRDFGRLRLESEAWPAARRLLRAAAFPLAGAAMTLRAAQYAAESGRLAEWGFFTPVQFFGHALWCAGEAYELLRVR